MAIAELAMQLQLSAKTIAVNPYLATIIIIIIIIISLIGQLTKRNHDNQ